MKKLFITWWEKLTGNTLLKRLLTVLSLDILVKASAFILLPIYLRLMTQAEYGIFNYILSITYSFSTILNLGLFIPQSKLYHDLHENGEHKKLLYNINILLLASLVVIVLPIYVFRIDYFVIKILFKNPINYNLYRLWILAAIVTALFSYMLTNFLYTSEKIRVINTYNLMRVLCINIISILALYTIKETDSIAIRFIVTSSIEFLLLLIFYRYYIQQMLPHINIPLMIRALKMGLPIMISTLFSTIINFGDKFFLEKRIPYQELSVYYLAFSCASVISIISMSLQNVWLPLFFKEKDLEQNLRKTKKMTAQLLLVLIGLSLMIMLVVYICLKLSIIPEAYSEVIYILPLLLCSQIVICLALLYSNYLSYFERTSLVLWAGLFVSAVSITFNIILIPLWKIYGAATTLLLSNTCYLVIYYFIIRFYRRKHLNTHSVKTPEV